MPEDLTLLILWGLVGALAGYVIALRRFGPAPKKVPAAAPGQPLDTPSEPGAVQSLLRKISAPDLAADILLVDDSAVARAKLRRLFEPAGYRVHLARDGVEALAMLEQGRYALMITDLEMPNMDGVTLINTCLARPQVAPMPILAISGHENLRAKFNQCRRVSGVHRKPWVDDILLSHVGTLVGTRHGAGSRSQHPGLERQKPQQALTR
jgi:CheY-like chemotaxis protein